MERVYALGVTCIEFIQDWFQEYEDYFEFVNELSNPHHVVELMFPAVSIVDSVFASQLLLCVAFGGWLNAVMKWWLLEDRPYWWIRETSFYSGIRRPQLRQFRQTCETGPGCPSGHTTTMAMLLVLTTMWMSHWMNDRNFYIWWWKYLVYPLFFVTLVSVMMARMFVATHFPHQCLLGALIGCFLAPALCIYVSDPYIWQYGPHGRLAWRRAASWHAVSAITTVAIAALTYVGLQLCGWDPLWTIKLAFRWCETPENIHVSSTPMYALVQSTGYLLGWALSVTPAVAEYRHYSTNRSLIISGFVACLGMYGLRHIDQNLCKANTLRYYLAQFAMAASKPPLLLRLAPGLAQWPYKMKTKIE